MKIDRPIVYVPLGLAIVSCIVILSFEFNQFSTASGIKNLSIFALCSSLVFGICMLIGYRKQLDSDNLYVVVGCSVLFGFVIILSLSSSLNRLYATQNCETASYEIIDYRARFASGYGKLEKGKPKANQWVLSIKSDDKIETYVLKKDISDRFSVTNRVDLEFCSGAFGTKYLNVRP